MFLQEHFMYGCTYMVVISRWLSASYACRKSHMSSFRYRMRGRDALATAGEAPALRETRHYFATEKVAMKRTQNATA